ncbi:MAG TPA: NAD(P)/FAD-dependent oxidoreductase [Terriglobia bacterium]|nr:NAD(P)/FAD-dependent oxidoreductase [Terriglobia bacterium]
MERRHQVVILGGGFAGLSAAHTLRHAPVDVTLIDRRNFHLFQPLLYQVATGGLSPANIAAPLRGVVKKYKNTQVLLGEAIDIDAGKRRVILKDGAVPYDTLIVGTGARHHYFGHDDWAQFAPGLKTLEDATAIRRQIFLAFEAAERDTDSAKERAWLTFVIVGAGPSGVELAGALSEIAHDTLKHDFRRVDPSQAQIILVEAADRVLPSYPSDLSEHAAESLRRLHVTLRTGATVTEVRQGAVTLETKAGKECIAARTVLWAAGVQASRLGQVLSRAAGAQIDRSGRPRVAPDLSLPGHPEILVVGDLANFSHPEGKPLPGVAQVAIQQGRYAARLIQARLRGATLPDFHYQDKGNMATIGRAAAVVELPWLHFSGYPAWLAWLFIHLLYIVEFQNRLLVMVQWAWNYLSFNRSARLITGESPFPLDL